MLTRVDLKNFCPLNTLAWSNLGPSNFMIGGNGSDKTFLLGIM